MQKKLYRIRWDRGSMYPCRNSHKGEGRGNWWRESVLVQWSYSSIIDCDYFFAVKEWQCILIPAAIVTLTWKYRILNCPSSIGNMLITYPVQYMIVSAVKQEPSTNTTRPSSCRESICISQYVATIIILWWIVYLTVNNICSIHVVKESKLMPWSLINLLFTSGWRCKISCLEMTFDSPSQMSSDLELKWTSLATCKSSIAMSCPLNEFPTTTTT